MIWLEKVTFCRDASTCPLLLLYGDELWNSAVLEKALTSSKIRVLQTILNVKLRVEVN